MRPNQVAILGAGPIGLDAALACLDAGWPCTVYEAGAGVGTQVRAWGHVSMFTPWELNLSPRMRRRLTATDHPIPGDGTCPTGAELATILDRLAAIPALAGRIRPQHRVIAIGRAGLLKHDEIGTPRRAATPFLLFVDTPDGERIEQADLVLDCTGTYGQPNTLGDGGIPAPGERALDGRILRTIPRVEDPARWAGTVLLVGAGKSAQTAARDLAALPDTHVDWIVRNPNPDWGAIPDDTLPQRQALADTAKALAAGGSDRVTVHTGASVVALHGDGPRITARVNGSSGVSEIAVDHVVGLTGYVGDASIYRQLQVHECYATAAPMNLAAALLGSASADCLAQPALGADLLRNPEPHFFILGAKSYGRTNTFLLRVGYDQVDRVLSLYQS